MNWYIIFYIMSIADSLGTFSIWIAVLATITLIICSILKMPAELMNDGSPVREDQRIFEKDNEQGRRNLNKIWRLAIIFTVVFWFLYIAIPDRKDMILIVAGGTVGEFVANDENAQKLPSEVFQYLRKEVLEATTELDGELSKEIRKELGMKTKEQILKELNSLSEEELRKIQDSLTDQ